MSELHVPAPPQKPRRPPQPEKEPRPPGALSALILHHTVTALLLCGALAMGIWGYLTHRKGGFVYAQAPLQEGSSKRYLIASQEARIKLAAETYRLIHQTAPIEVSVLVDEGLLHPDDLRYPSPQVSYELHIDKDQLLVTSTVDTSNLPAPPSPEADETILSPVE